MIDRNIGETLWVGLWDGPVNYGRSNIYETRLREDILMNISRILNLPHSEAHLACVSSQRVQKRAQCTSPGVGRKRGGRRLRVFL